MRASILTSLPAAAILVHGHGLISSPAARAPGDATAAACGPKIAAEIAGDPTSHVEGLPELGASDPEFDAALCNPWLCKGLQFGDNAANVQEFVAGQTVEVQVDLTIPHVGSANVSVVDTAANAVLGDPLVLWPSGYADEREFYAGTTPKDQTDFEIVIPDDLGGKCAEPGECVSPSFSGLPCCPFSHLHPIISFFLSVLLFVLVLDTLLVNPPSRALPSRFHPSPG